MILKVYSSNSNLARRSGSRSCNRLSRTEGFERQLSAKSGHCGRPVQRLVRCHLPIRTSFLKMLTITLAFERILSLLLHLVRAHPPKKGSIEKLSCRLPNQHRSQRSPIRLPVQSKDSQAVPLRFCIGISCLRKRNEFDERSATELVPPKGRQLPTGFY